MRRRDLLTLVAAAAIGWPFVLQAQPCDGMRRLGIFMPYLANDSEEQARAAALVQGLGVLGWTEGGKLRVNWRLAEGLPSLFDRYALFAAGSTSTQALWRRTDTIPIVFATVADPVGQGLIDSLARPGGNITGFDPYDPPVAGKWLEMLTRIIPPVARATVLYSPVTAPYASVYLRAIEDAAPSLTVAVRAAPCSDDAEIEAMMAGLAHEERAGVLVLPDRFTISHRDAIIALAARHRLPAVYPFRFYATAGGLMCDGTDQVDLFRRVASYVDRILRRAKPADLPVQGPTKFELVISLKTAQALGTTVAPPLLATADEVIE